MFEHKPLFSSGVQITLHCWIKLIYAVTVPTEWDCQYIWLFFSPHFWCPAGLHASGRRGDLCRCAQGTHKRGCDWVSIPLRHEEGHWQAGRYRHQRTEDSSGGGQTSQTKVLLWQPLKVGILNKLLTLYFLEKKIHAKVFCILCVANKLLTPISATGIDSSLVCDCVAILRSRSHRRSRSRSRRSRSSRSRSRSHSRWECLL